MSRLSTTMPRRRAWLWAVLGTSSLLLASLAVAAGAPLAPAASVGGESGWGGNNSTEPNYTVTFHEVGVPAGTNWSVVVCITWWCWQDGGAQFNSSNTSTMTFSLPNGTYRYHVFPVNGNASSPDRGVFTVNGSSPATIDVSFLPPETFAVTFTETGLPTGTNWSVLLFPGAFAGRCDRWGGWDHCHDQDGQDRASAGTVHPADGWGGGHGHFFTTSNTSTITFEVTNGTYNYTVFNVTGYTLLGAARGSVNVSGAAPAPVAVAFSAIPAYPVTFTETGLANGTNWSVWVFGFEAYGALGHGDGGRHHHHGSHVVFEGTSSTPTITLNLTNGTYRYHVGWVDGYYSNDSRGSFVVAGEPTPTITVNFTAVPQYNVSFESSGLPSGTDWGITVVGVGGHLAGHHGEHIDVQGAARGVVSFSLPRGHYRFRAIPLSGWAPSGGPRNHRLVVTDQPRTTTIDFVPTTHGGHGGARPSVQGSPVVSGSIAAVRTALAARCG